MTAHDPASPSMAPESTPPENGAESGVSGVLSAEEREVVGDMAGCGCCSSRYDLDKVLPDNCPVDNGGHVDHSYSDRDGCNQMLPLEEIVDRIVREHTERALAEVENVVRHWEQYPALRRGTAAAEIRRALHRARAAREEQDR